jgi:hypothetical protein
MLYVILCTLRRSSSKQRQLFIGVSIWRATDVHYLAEHAAFPFAPARERANSFCSWRQHFRAGEQRRSGKEIADFNYPITAGFSAETSLRLM